MGSKGENDFADTVLACIEFMPVAAALLDEKLVPLRYNTPFAEALAASGVDPKSAKQIQSWVGTMWESEKAVRGTVTSPGGKEYKLLFLPQFKSRIDGSARIAEQIRTYLQNLREVGVTSREGKKILDYCEECLKSLARRAGATLTHIPKPQGKRVAVICPEPLARELLVVYVRRLGFVPKVFEKPPPQDELERSNISLVIADERSAAKLCDVKIPVVVLAEFGKKTDVALRFPKSTVIEMPPRFDEVRTALEGLDDGSG